MAQKIEPRFSLFPAGYTNEKGRTVMSTEPSATATIGQVYNYIVSERAREATEALRSIVARRQQLEAQPDLTEADRAMVRALEDEERRQKMAGFLVATFGGVFTYRRAASLQQESGLLVADIDDLPSTRMARDLQDVLVHDAQYATALCFLSPRGQGLKWVVRLGRQEMEQQPRERFDQLAAHVSFNYGITLDTSGKDICRACFLPWDPDAYVDEAQYDAPDAYANHRALAHHKETWQPNMATVCTPAVAQTPAAL